MINSIPTVEHTAHKSAINTKIVISLQTHQEVGLNGHHWPPVRFFRCTGTQGRLEAQKGLCQSSWQTHRLREP